MTALMNYRWPGNVRELEHAIERAVIVARESSIRLRELPAEIVQKPQVLSAGDGLDLLVQEQATIERALQKFHGNRREAAEALNISTVTLWRKMKAYALAP
jgi:transcriptional regulator with PAS, ATPase and Fis domain